MNCSTMVGPRAALARRPSATASAQSVTAPASAKTVTNSPPTMLAVDRSVA
jgi:hypothetical protein